MSTTHQAAVLPKVGEPIVVATRNTPEPGPQEILLQVKAVAFNPVDYFQRDLGVPPLVFPAVLASDTAGIVAKVGSDVPNPPAIGSRVLAITTAFYHEGNPDYGATQQYAIHPWQCAIPLPENLSFEQGSIIPLALITALSAYTTLGLPLDYKPKQGESILIWGASSSVGSWALQTAKVMGYTVYATAGAKNLDYVMSLGAHAAFDYKDPQVVSQIVQKVREDGNDLRTAHVIVNDSLQQTLDILKQTKGDGPALVAHAPLLPQDHPTLENTEIKFTYPPTDPEERMKHVYQCLHVWLKNALEAGQVVPSPHIHAVSGGLGAVEEAMNFLKAGVSAQKVVVSI